MIGGTSANPSPVLAPAVIVSQLGSPSHCLTEEVAPADDLVEMAAVARRSVFEISTLCLREANTWHVLVASVSFVIMAKVYLNEVFFPSLI